MSWEYFVINVYSLRFFQSQTKTLLKLVNYKKNYVMSVIMIKNLG